MQKVTKSLSAEEARDARKWFVVDAEDAVLGRLATRVAGVLRGKHNPAFTPHVDCGDFVVSASMDRSAKLWDVVTGRAKQAFRGHVDSVNSVCFQPFSNTIATGSGDKTVSLWDCRSGLCVQTFYGHQNAVNDTAFAMRGDVVARRRCKCWAGSVLSSIFARRAPASATHATNISMVTSHLAPGSSMVTGYGVEPRASFG